MSSVRLMLGDCLDVMPTLEANSVDAIVCDPPYMLNFMGKAFDRAKDNPAASVDVWREALRVAKPGAHLLAFGGDRTHHRMMIAIEDAGWEIRTCLYWIFGSGFPKSLAVDKAIDRAAGRIGESVIAIKREIRRRYEQQSMTLSEFNAACGFEASGYLRESSTWASVLPSRDKWERIKAVIGCNGELDSLFTEAEREVVGQASWQNSANHFVPGADHKQRVQLDITAPATDAAKQWHGWGTALKPAAEIIVMARKPLTGTVAENVLAWGTGGINVDACRIPHGDDVDLSAKQKDFNRMGYMGAVDTNGVDTYKANGRWPANVLLSEDAAALLDEQSGERKSGGGDKHGRKSSTFCASTDWEQFKGTSIGGDTGGASRFFYVAKASRRDRNSDGAVNNIHPTCKPCTLMQYLCRMVTPPNGVILDPFMGSGSTGKGAVLEGFNFIGIELDAEYLTIAEKRISHAQAQPVAQAQPALFEVSA